ncbi:MAG: hypothetical protein JO242_17730 [Streptosporangiaceae bacterium]|nr:hypothetical protein [Streptosporangiaceae bacterium]
MTSTAKDNARRPVTNRTEQFRNFAQFLMIGALSRLRLSRMAMRPGSHAAP